MRKCATSVSRPRKVLKPSPLRRSCSCNSALRVKGKWTDLQRRGFLASPHRRVVRADAAYLWERRGTFAHHQRVFHRASGDLVSDSSSSFAVSSPARSSSSDPDSDCVLVRKTRSVGVQTCGSEDWSFWKYFPCWWGDEDVAWLRLLSPPLPDIEPAILANLAILDTAEAIALDLSLSDVRYRVLDLIQLSPSGRSWLAKHQRRRISDLYTPVAGAGMPEDI